MSVLTRYRIIVTSGAISDIRGICSYIGDQSPQNAGMMAEKFISAINSLKILPRRFKILENRIDKAKTVHAMPLRPFIVYYRVDDSARLVRILSVRHGARRQPKRFR